MNKMTRIPIKAARHIAETYGYDQVVIYARRVGYDNMPEGTFGEHMTTYGTTKVHCIIAAKMGAVLKNFMGWSVL